MIHDLTTGPAYFDDSVLRQHLTDTNAVLFTAYTDPDTPEETATYALVRAANDIDTDDDESVSAGSLIVYYADSATNVFFSVDSFAQFIPAAAYDLI